MDIPYKFITDPLLKGIIIRNGNYILPPLQDVKESMNLYRILVLKIVFGDTSFGRSFFDKLVELKLLDSNPHGYSIKQEVIDKLISLVKSFLLLFWWNDIFLKKLEGDAKKIYDGFKSLPWLISLQECRKVLGPEYDDFTDEQIESIRNILYTISRLMIDWSK